MPTLQVPMSIWIASTPDEKDGFYLSAGFSELYPIEDNGTDGTTLRLIQTVPFTGDFNTDAPGIAPTVDAPILTTNLIQAGDGYERL